MSVNTGNHDENHKHDLQWSNPEELHVKRLGHGVSAAAYDAYRAVIAQLAARVEELERMPVEPTELIRIYAKTEELKLQIDSLTTLVRSLGGNSE